MIFQETITLYNDAGILDVLGIAKYIFLEG